MDATDSRSAIRRPRCLKAWARVVVRDLLVSTPGSLSRADGGPFLRLLHCHHVFDDQVSEFRRVITLLLSSGRFVDTATSVSMIWGETPIAGRNKHLSFGRTEPWKTAGPK